MLEIVFVILLAWLENAHRERNFSTRTRKVREQAVWTFEGKLCLQPEEQHVVVEPGGGGHFSKSCSKREASRIHDITELRL